MRTVEHERRPGARDGERLVEELGVDDDGCVTGTGATRLGHVDRAVTHDEADRLRLHRQASLQAVGVDGIPTRLGGHDAAVVGERAGDHRGRGQLTVDERAHPPRAHVELDLGVRVDAPHLSATRSAQPSGTTAATGSSGEAVGGTTTRAHPTARR